VVATAVPRLAHRGDVIDVDTQSQHGNGLPLGEGG
jgi:hypothetical protein